MSNQLNNMGILRKFLMAVSIGMISLTMSPAYSACDEITVNCKNQQIKVLKKQIAEFREEEMEHEHIGHAHGAEEAPLYTLFTGCVRAITKAAIWLSKRY